MCVEYGHCTVRQTNDDVLNSIVKVTNGLLVSLAIPYVVIRIMEIVVRVMAGMSTVTIC